MDSKWLKRSIWGFIAVLSLSVFGCVQEEPVEYDDNDEVEEYETEKDEGEILEDEDEVPHEDGIID